MSCKVELYQDIFQLFKWFNRLEYSKITKDDIKLSALSIYGTTDINFENKRDFFKECSKIIEESFSNLFTELDYNLYLFVAVEVKSPISKVAHYKKVWKGLSKEWDISGFEFSPEILVNINNKYHYIGLARFKLEHIFTALEIQHSNIIKNFIFASNRNNILSEEKVETFFNDAFGESSKLATFHFHEEDINYFKLFAYYCTNEDIVFRIGDSGEDVELDIIFSYDFCDKLRHGIELKDYTYIK